MGILLHIGRNPPPMVEEYLVEKGTMDTTKVFVKMLDEAIKSEPLTFKDFDRTLNVQDQLQGMVGGQTELLSSSLLNLCSDMNADYGGMCYWWGFDSTEQLLLALVMKAKCNKMVKCARDGGSFRWSDASLPL